MTGYEIRLVNPDGTDDHMIWSTGQEARPFEGDQGLDILAHGFPKSQPVSCALLDRFSDPVDTVTAGSSSLSYDPATDQYTYVWKTEKRWAGMCRMLNMKLDDGTQHLACFQLK